MGMKISAFYKDQPAFDKIIWQELPQTGILFLRERLQIIFDADDKSIIDIVFGTEFELDDWY